MSNGGRIHPYGDCTTKDWHIKLKYSPVVFPEYLSAYSEPDLLFLILTPGYWFFLGDLFWLAGLVLELLVVFCFSLCFLLSTSCNMLSGYSPGV